MYIQFQFLKNSDGAAALVGSLGVVPGANVGDNFVIGEPGTYQMHYKLSYLILNKCSFYSSWISARYRGPK